MRGPANRVAKLGMLLAVSLMLHVLESALPLPLPFVRLGLANIVTVYAIIAMGVGDAMVLTILRVAISSLLVGTFLGPSFAMALGGGVAATLAMWVAFRLAAPPLGVVGVSLVGALFHNVAQLSVLAILFTGPGPAVHLMPAAMLMAAIAGFGTGLVALFTFKRIDRGGLAGD